MPPVAQVGTQQDLVRLLRRAKVALTVKGTEGVEVSNEDTEKLINEIDEVLAVSRSTAHHCFGAYCDGQCDLGDQCPKRTGKK